MNAESFARFVEKIDDLWPGLPGSWSDSSLRHLRDRVTPYTGDSARLALDRLANSEVQKFRPDPADIIRIVDDLGVPERRALKPRNDGQSKPWPEVSQELFGEYVPFAQAGARLQEAR